MSVEDCFKDYALAIGLFREDSSLNNAINLNNCQRTSHSELLWKYLANLKESEIDFQRYQQFCEEAIALIHRNAEFVRIEQAMSKRLEDLQFLVTEGTGRYLEKLEGELK